MAHFVAVLTSLAGSILTAANWRASNCSWGVAYLSDLLVKPGYRYLRQLPDLHSHFAWHGQLMLNVTLPKPNTDNQYILKSPYDGSRMSVARDAVLELVSSLNPQYLIVAAGEDSVFCCENAEVIHLSSGNGACPRYLQDNDMLGQPVELSENNPFWIESDKPAQHGHAGHVYRDDMLIDITSRQYQQQFVPIDTCCQCPICQAKLSLAYLHHIYQHTPLLGQRLLIQHNVFYYQHSIAKNHLPNTA